VLGALQLRQTFARKIQVIIQMPFPEKEFKWNFPNATFTKIYYVSYNLPFLTFLQFFQNEDHSLFNGCMQSL